jgi:uncharacterized membrane protein (UPF0136 family)
VHFTRTGSASSIAAGVAFCALYLLSFVRLGAGQCYGHEIALLASIVLALGSLPHIAEWVGRPLPREYCMLGIYGTAVFANAIHFWVGLGLSLSLILLAVSDDALSSYKQTKRPLVKPE